jgi:hypothetical protein
VLIVSVGAPPATSAMWGWLALDDAVRDSDLVVVGTLSDVAEWSRAGWDYGDGAILVTEVLWGDVRAGDWLRLRWDNPSGLACPRVEHAQSAGVEYIWLLTRSADGSVRADHPCRVVAAGERADVLRSRAGERKTVCLRTDTIRYSSSDGDVVTLVFRNPSGAPVSYPGVQVSSGRVTLDSRVRLTLREGFDPGTPEIAPRPGAIVELSDVPPLVVPPGEEVRVAIFVRSVFDPPPGVYFLCATVDGYEPSNRVLVDLEPRGYFEPSGLPGAGRLSITLVLVELVSACLALAGLGIWALRVSSISARGTVRRTLTLAVLYLAMTVATFAIGYSATLLWSAIPIVW